MTNLRKNVGAFIQDQSSDIVDYYMCINIAALTLAQNTVLDSKQVVVTDASGVVNGTYICLQEGSRAFQARVLSKATNTITLDTPLDYAFTTSANIHNRKTDLNVNGSVTPVSAFIKPIAGVKWDITRIIFQMTHSSAGGDAVFGNLTALTNGIVLRKSNGVHHTIFNAKTNGELANRVYDLIYTDRSVPTQIYGTRAMRTFNAQANNGVVIRLDGDNNDSLELLIQDDLSGLTTFKVVVQGHLVED